MRHYLETRLLDVRHAASFEILLLVVIGAGQAARGCLASCLAMVALAMAILADARHKRQILVALRREPDSERILLGALSELRPTRIPWALRRGGVLAGALLQALLIPFSLLTMALLFLSLLPAADRGLRLIELGMAWLALWRLFGRSLLISNRSDQLALDWKEEIEEALETGRLTDHCRCTSGGRRPAPAVSGLIENRL